SHLILDFFSKKNYVLLIEEMQNDPTRLKIRAKLKREYFLETRMNQKSNTLSFCLLKDEKRIWGLDYDVLRDWHIHPFENPDSHLNISPKTLPEILEIFHSIMEELYSKE
ncbi:MAG TPA: hypothetical protein PK683_13145, partial [Leptospiraceae bacterium]|nr:hypothetical protein [Leptospiraceae bacterium]